MARQVWEFRTADRRVRATIAGETVADSSEARLLIESHKELDYYFPINSIHRKQLIPSDYTESSGYRGTRRFWHLKVGERLVDNAAWTYDNKENRPDLGGYLAFNWEAMDHWYEEEEEVFMHPRHPYHRVDTVPSKRHVEIFFDGVKVADSKRPYLLFETGIRTRYYLPSEDVNMAYLESSDSETVCPYKGFAGYYGVRVNGETFPDTVWIYRDPIPEAPKIKGLLAFWPEKDRRIQILVDGEPPIQDNGH